MPGVTTAAGSRCRSPIEHRPEERNAGRACDQSSAASRRLSITSSRPIETVSAAEGRSTGGQPLVPGGRSSRLASWLLVASIAVLRYGVRLRRVYRALGTGSRVTSPDLLDTIDGLRSDANERRAIRLTTNAICPVPLALSGRHIVLPPRFLEDLDPEQQRAALAHELAHIVRRDPEWRIAVEVLERALFLQPLNRLARARLCDSAEFLCDEWAVRCTQSPLALARCLSVVASWWTPGDDAARRRQRHGKE